MVSLGSRLFELCSLNSFLKTAGPTAKNVGAGLQLLDLGLSVPLRDAALAMDLCRAQGVVHVTAAVLSVCTFCL